MKKLLICPVVLLSSSVFAWQPFVDMQMGEGMASNSILSGFSVKMNGDHTQYIADSLNKSGDNLSAKAGIGIMWSKYLGLELSYLRSISKLKSNLTYGPDSGHQSHDDPHQWTGTESTKFSAIDLGVVLNIPVTQDGRFYLHQQTGITYNTINRAISVNSTSCSNGPCDPVSASTNNNNASGLGFDIGVGFGYHFTNHFSAELGYDNLGTLKGEKNIQFYSAGIKYLI